MLQPQLVFMMVSMYCRGNPRMGPRGPIGPTLDPLQTQIYHALADAGLYPAARDRGIRSVSGLGSRNFLKIFLKIDISNKEKQQNIRKTHEIDF